eukprot:3180343-Heterocapsa_arctica.AAC.1
MPRQPARPEAPARRPAGWKRAMASNTTARKHRQAAEWPHLIAEPGASNLRLQCMMWRPLKKAAM